MSYLCGKNGFEKISIALESLDFFEKKFFIFFKNFSSSENILEIGRLKKSRNFNVYDS